MDGVFYDDKGNLLAIITEGDDMSVSKYDYIPEKCDGDYCPGDCDLCSKANLAEEDWKTDCSWGKPEDLGETDADI